MYDVIIIGAGPAGISASLYTKRANLNTLVIYNGDSNLERTEIINNYYGFQDGISGRDLYISGIEQAKNLDVEVVRDEVVKIEMQDEKFKIITTCKKYESKALILATGTNKNVPNIQGLKEFEGKGVSYCAICDGFFYKDKSVAVIGNGNYAVSETNDLINVARNVTILTNGREAPEIRADNVKINEKEIKEIHGQDKVEEIEFKDNTRLKTDGIFIAVGTAGTTEFARKLGVLTDNNRILVNENMETNIPGLYACGDCTGGLLQISKSVYEGAKAGLSVVESIRRKD